MKHSIAACVIAISAALLSAPEARAFAFDMRLNPASDDPTSGPLFLGDEVIVDIYLDAGPGLSVFGVAVVFDDGGLVDYGPGSSSMPSYVLYTPAVGASASTVLVPSTSPPGYWAGDNEPGKRAVIIQYLEPSFDDAQASGQDVWLATLTFPINFQPCCSRIDLRLDYMFSTAVIAYGNDVTSQATATGSFLVVTPEPTTAVLVGLGVMALMLAGRRAG